MFFVVHKALVLGNFVFENSRRKITFLMCDKLLVQDTSTEDRILQRSAELIRWILPTPTSFYPCLCYSLLLISLKQNTPMLSPTHFSCIFFFPFPFTNGTKDFHHLVLLVTPARTISGLSSKFHFHFPPLNANRRSH